MKKIGSYLVLMNLFFACTQPLKNKESAIDSTNIKPTDELLKAPAARSPEAQERHLKNLQQITFGGENAEAYFDATGTRLIFQSTRDHQECDQIYTMNIDGSNVKQVNTLEGRNTCAYFILGQKKIIYASTGQANKKCPAPPSHSLGYVWPLYHDYNIFSANEDGSNVKPLFQSGGYDAEATASADGKYIVFTSTQNGDIDLYRMDSDGKNVKQLTHELGYDGGAFFSADGKKIIYRRSSPMTPEEVADYKKLLSQELVRPGLLDLWVMDADGKNKKQVTHVKGANFAPFFFPKGDKVIFSSNMGDAKGRNFDIYSINLDGTGLERITYSEEFDGFPMFSPDGKKLVFSSNRFNQKKGDTNVFIADWIE